MYNINTFVIMKSFLNYSKLAIITLFSSSLFMACSDEISETTCDTQYVANAGSIKNAGKAVDLGLASGTKWADMNVGATSETDNGILFIWGDITGTQIKPTTATSYTDVTSLTPVAVLYKLYQAAQEETGVIYDTINVHKESYLLSEHPLTEIDSIREVRFDSIKSKYPDSNLNYSINVGESEYEIIVNMIEPTTIKYFASTQGGFNADNGASISGAPVYNIVGDVNHDPATANWGNNWRMPTNEQVRELIESCKWEFTGNGYRVTGPNKNSIFLPAAGYRYGDKWYGNGNSGYYATGQIFGTYHFPSMMEQYKGSLGEISETGNMPNMLIFQHGQFDNSINIYSNMMTSYGVSIRPVTK